MPLSGGYKISYILFRVNFKFLIDNMKQLLNMIIISILFENY